MFLKFICKAFFAKNIVKIGKKRRNKWPKQSSGAFSRAEYDFSAKQAAILGKAGRPYGYKYGRQKRPFAGEE